LLHNNIAWKLPAKFESREERIETKVEARERCGLRVKLALDTNAGNKKLERVFEWWKRHRPQILSIFESR
jgi:DNA-binding PadR family transcriptional regulator